MLKKTALVIQIIITILLVVVSFGVAFPAPITFAYISLISGIFIYSSKDLRAKLILSGYLTAPLVISSIIINWPVAFYRPVKGFVRDAITGEPVVGAIFAVRWHTYVGTMAGSVGSDFQKDFSVSDKDGSYTVSGGVYMHPFSMGAQRIIEMKHPLYENDQLTASQDKLLEGGKWSERSWFMLRKDFTLLSCEDKYRPGVIENYSSAVHDITGFGHDYFSYIPLARQLGIVREIDWDKIIASRKKMIESWQDSNTVGELKKDLAQILEASDSAGK